jgi:dTDP-4-amino-4,6-dideoxygalactose transaminase
MWQRKPDPQLGPHRDSQNDAPAQSIFSRSPQDGAEHVYVTRPLLPELEDFVPYLERIWQSGMLTNAGAMHNELEAALCDYLGVANISLLNNGTSALLLALDALDIRGEVITTPFTFIATTHALAYRGIEPVFADIDPVTLNLDPEQVEARIGPKTAAIMPVHCYGTPCDLDAFDALSEKYAIPVIYDAAHAFGVSGEHGSILRRGTASVLSFHATKVFHTFEGGAVVTSDPETKRRVDSLRNFGYDSELSISSVGINAKLNEVCAAMGLAQLELFGTATDARREVDAAYRELLAKIEHIRCLEPPANFTTNCGYFPIFVEPGYPVDRETLYQRLIDNGIMARRYFYPLTSDTRVYRHLPSAAPQNLPNAVTASTAVLCLPIFPGLSRTHIERIAAIIASPAGQAIGDR